ncbi:MAG: SPASM domain-containing protein [Clostridiales bacterium]|nr:SPASM domain-containing protein [Clostridiales bacterium]
MAPYRYTFILNTQCNFHCPYCFESESFHNKNESMQKSQIDAAFRLIGRQMEENPDQKKANIEIFGGEPLLPHAKPDLAYLLDKISSYDYTASIQTNGYYLLENLDLLSNDSNPIKVIQITIDGPMDIHNIRRISHDGANTFRKITEGIDAFLALHLPIRLDLRTNVDRDNIEYLEELVSIYEEKGWTQSERVSFIAAPVENRSGNLLQTSKLLSWSDLFDRLFPLSTDKGGIYDLSIFKAINYFRSYFYNILNDLPTENPLFPKVNYCDAAAAKYMIFHPDGRIYLCPESVGMEELAIGQYYPDVVIDQTKIALWANQTILQREQCKSCEISTFCGGGCCMASLTKNGAMDKPVCEDTQEIIASYFQKIAEGM